MPRIFDNIHQSLLPALRDTLGIADRADFCVGYFNLRGWKQIDSYVERWPGGSGGACRLLVGMQRLPQDELREALSLIRADTAIDNQTAIRIKKKLAQEFRDQLTVGVPTNEDEAGLRRLAAQIRAKKVVVKLFLRHQLHAKLYLLFRPDPVSPTVGYLGSSNLTFAGLASQGELNIDVVDQDACTKLASWFEDRWNDRFCIDISDELVQIIETSWAGSMPIAPYQIYVKMAYHLAEEARAGLSEFRVPREFEGILFEFQKAAVQIAAHHVRKRGGVMIGDVVGLGKTLMATALMKIFEDATDSPTLIICPKNLVPMWEDHREHYHLSGKVVSISRVQNELRDLRRYKYVLIDESHNLRNRSGKKYRAIAEYIEANDSNVILLSATPYNKSYLDLSSQLRLFLDDELDIGIRPERIIREMGEVEFIKEHQCAVRTLRAFEKTPHADDWRDLMRLYLVRRTRSFIRDNYAKLDVEKNRKYLEFPDKRRSYFPDRIPKTVKFKINESDPNDTYAAMFAPDVVDAVNHLILPRYGLGNYEKPTMQKPPTNEEAKVLADLSRAGNRLKGFCRTNIFKRLESGGYAFVLSLERHILRNFIFLHAIENDLQLPIGTQDMGLLDAPTDADTPLFEPDDDSDTPDPGVSTSGLRTEKAFKARAAEIYAAYAKQFKKRFKWLRPSLFVPQLGTDLQTDARALIKVLKDCGEWEADRDQKLKALVQLVAKKHANEKVLIFTQFADTVEYLLAGLRAANVASVEGVTGDSANPTAIAWKFSPVSNNKRNSVRHDEELRVIIATDVLSEGQNLQDCHVIVNFDLPWAIIRLIQRAGRVDRIGQNADKILCYSFLPAEGVERIINLRARVRQRLRENAEVVGTDEEFFDDDHDDKPLVNLYNEKAGILDGDDDREVDLASYAYQIWKNAVDADPALEQAIKAMSDVVYATRPHEPTTAQPEGVLVYVRTAEGTDALAWIDKDGKNVTESQLAILRAAECAPDTPALERHDRHHELVTEGVKLLVAEEKAIGGQLGRPSGARFRTYERLKAYLAQHTEPLFVASPEHAELTKTVDDVHRYTLTQAATDTLNRQLKSGISNHELAELAVNLRKEGRLSRVTDEQESDEPRIICSMGLRKST